MNLTKIFKQISKSFSSLCLIIGQRSEYIIINRRKILRGILIIGLITYTLYHFNPKRTKIYLSYYDSLENKQNIDKLTLLSNNHFRPTFYLAHTLMQFIYGALPHYRIRYSRDYIKLADGGQICIDWALPLRKVGFPASSHQNKYYPYDPPQNNKILFIIHGLTGGSDTEYIQDLVYEFQKAGYRVAVLNHRGINQRLTNPFIYHGGDLTDLECAIKFAKDKFPDAPMIAVGTSFGGNQLLRYLGKKGKDVEFIAGVSVAGPFDIDIANQAIENTIYEKAMVNYYFNYTLIPNLDVLQKLEPSFGINWEEAFKSKNIREFHNKVTIKLFGHKDIAEYFKTSKVDNKRIENISIPLLCLHSKDDPIILQNSIPIDALKNNKNILYAQTSHGAHICWFSGLLPQRVIFFS